MNNKRPMEVNFYDNTPPIIVITERAQQKINGYVDICDVEIGWLGSVVKKENKYIIDDIFLFRQTVSATQTEISANGLAEFTAQLMEENPENWQEIISSLKYWGHSHVNMPVNPSGTDVNAMTEVFGDCGFAWYIRGIHNKQGDCDFSLYVYEGPVKVAIHHLKVEYEKYIDPDIEAEIKTNFDELVSVRKYQHQPSPRYTGMPGKRKFRHSHPGIDMRDDIEKTELELELEKFEPHQLDHDGPVHTGLHLPYGYSPSNNDY
jgi:hypothetical protein